MSGELVVVMNLGFCLEKRGLMMSMPEDAPIRRLSEIGEIVLFTTSSAGLYTYTVRQENGYH